MKNITEFKKRLIPGTPIHTIKHSLKDPSLDKDLGIRTINSVQSDMFSILNPGNTITWLELPKKYNARFYSDDPNKITIIFKIDGIPKPFLSYKFI